MDDAIKMLCDAIRDSGARMTMDRRRSIKLPCWRCETTDSPRDLVEIGRYTRAVGGGNLPGDKIVRPMCPACVVAIAEMTPAASEAVAPVEPVAVVWIEDPEYTPTVQAKAGSLTLSVWPAEFPKGIIGWVWDVTFGEQLIARSGIRGIQSDRDAAKAAAIAAARAWRDSIRL